ncbi:MAG: DUF975 family protein [Lachnospiraceae bacterium]|nr:DUF975 family protein [Lachnospiraceae bacterium]
MWDRRELKARGMAAFRANYWKCVLVGLIHMLIFGGGFLSVRNHVNVNNGGGTQSGSVTYHINNLSGVDTETLKAFIALSAAIVGIALIWGIITFFITELLLNPLKVGCARFFRENSDSPAGLPELIYGYKENFWNMVKTVLLQDIFEWLWALLFIIPGIVKFYSYRMVPYILAEDPNIGSLEAISLSRQMMNGNKWKAFKLDLSYLGWDILCLFTAGILAVFFVKPYHEAANAELYKAVKAEFLS